MQANKLIIKEKTFLIENKIKYKLRNHMIMIISMILMN